MRTPLELSGPAAGGLFRDARRVANDPPVTFRFRRPVIAVCCHDSIGAPRRASAARPHPTAPRSLLSLNSMVHDALAKFDRIYELQAQGRVFETPEDLWGEAKA